MQVTCPNCRARYAVDPLAIGPSGRTVQCARCSERWFQMVKVEPPPEPPPPPSEPPAAAPPTREPAAGKPRGRRLLPWLSSLTPWRKKAAPPKKEPKAAPRPLPKPAASDPTEQKTAARANDNGPATTMPRPVPDFVIRPASRGAMLPALIEPRADRRMSLILIGTVMVLLILAAGVLAFHNVIADMLPAEWRSILRFNA